MCDEFASLSLSARLLAVIKELGYKTPTPIQRQSIPVLLDRKDLIGQSKTGSGKTAAFALPILQGLELRARFVQALVVCPTRELGAQVAREIRKLGRKHTGLQVLEVCGGSPSQPQASALERGVHVVVGTPGRLLDHLQRRSLDPRSLRVVVLDEADRMLDMGFQTQMESILKALPKSRQTVFFSATFPDTIEALSRTHQNNAVRVTIDEPDEIAPDIRQLVLSAEPEQKLCGLYWLLNEYPHESALIFCNFKSTVAKLENNLRGSGVSADCLHGDLDQFHRDQVLAKFRNWSVRVLVATDVAGRGIDVENLDLVINYELPDQPEIYLHRIGRTGRAGKLGVALSLATARETQKLADIETMSGVSIERLTPRLSPEADRVGSLARPARMDTILISGGRKDKLRPGDILGALTGDAGGLRGADIGKIEIHDRLTYVAVAKAVSRAATKSLNAGRIKAKRFRATLV